LDRPIIRRNIPKWAFFIFNVTFISLIQSILLMAFSAAPAYTILLSSQFEKDITAADLAYFFIEFGLILSEWVSDGQQWDFHAAKHKYQKDAKVPKGFDQEELDRGFVTSGLWAYSRHPNFTAEQLIWFFLYQWSCFATNVLYNWTFVGIGFLILIFQGSTWLTELISVGKYPEYAEYQRNVGMFMPVSFKPYKTTVPQPKIIRTSELAKRQSRKSK
jgi:steroid 5-alpha reductase family enzyme